MNKLSMRKLTLFLSAIAIATGAIDRPAVAAPNFQIAQTPEELREQQLERQREAERVLKEAERQRREVRENGLGGTQIEQRVNEQVTKVRESGGNPQTIREADAELGKLRQERQNINRNRFFVDPFYYPYFGGSDYYYRTVPGTVIFNTPVYVPDPNYRTNTGGEDYEYRPPTTGTVTQPRERAGQQNTTPNQENNLTQILASAGFNNGQIAPAVGLRWNNIGLEVGAIFNQDTFDRSVNDFSLPSNFLFNDLGNKKLSPQWGGDILGFFDVAPKVSLYGSVGLYFQSQARIAQSQATNDLFKQTNDTNVSGAIGGGVNYNPSDSVSIGVGYHSLRGVTARMGINF